MEEQRGSVVRVVGDAEDEDEEEGGFEPTPTDEPAQRQRAASRGKRGSRA
jgi:adenine-specific DNA-methyltransferase